MPKTLIILTHPNLSESTVNKRWAAALKQHTDRFTVHELYTVYNPGKIDATAEQKLIETHDALVWQKQVLLKHVANASWRARYVFAMQKHRTRLRHKKPRKRM